MTDLSFGLHFDGDMDRPVAFLLSTYDATGKWLFSWRADGVALAGYDGAQWCFAACDVDLQAVPVPGAVLLGMLGLGFAGRKLRKMC